MLNNSHETDGPAGPEFMDLLARLFNKAAGIERDPVDTGDGVLLYTSEVHLIDLAGRYPEESMSALAARLGVTKGAISQTAKKLEEKGYLERITLEGNNKTTFLRLTKTGQRAFDWHCAYHEFVNERISREVAGLGKRDYENVMKILGQIEKIFDDCPQTRKRVTREMMERQ